MPLDFKTESDCRLAFAEIVKGYSCDPSGSFFIRHASELIHAQTELKRREFLEEAKKAGVLPEKEKLVLLALHEHWAQADEQEYQQYLEEIESLRISLQKLVIPQQIAHMEQMMNDKISEHKDKWRTRAELLGLTCETYSSRKASEYHVLSAFFKDKLLTQPMFPQEERDDISADELSRLVDIYQESTQIFSDKNMKRIAVCPFFLNAYLVCNDNPFFFFGKPIVDLTIYQLALFSRGAFYKNVVEESPQRPPEEYYDDLDKVIKFYDQQWSIILGKRNQNQLMR